MDKLNATDPSTKPWEFYWSSPTIAGAVNLLCFTSSNHLSIPRHSPLHHDSLVSLGFWWVILLKVSWKVAWVISDGSFLCMFVNPFKELSNWVSQELEVLKPIVFMWLSTHFFVLFLWSLLIYLVQTPDLILTWNLFMFVSILGGCVVLLVIKLFN